MADNKAERPIYQTVRVNVKQGPGCCGIIMWIVGIVVVLAACGLLTQMMG